MDENIFGSLTQKHLAMSLHNDKDQNEMIKKSESTNFTLNG